MSAEMEDVPKRSIRKRRSYLHQSRRQKKPVKANSDVSGVELEATEYYFDNGLRKVYPYNYTFAAYVKGRWMGRTIIDVFSTEFKAEEKDVHEKNIVNGLLTVNGNKVTPDFVLGENQLLENTVHRHENPVLAEPIEVIADTAELLVVNKPASIPCHPCGRYKYNSLTSILQKEYGYRNLRILYRLDRMTSGVLILPKTTKVSVKMESEVRNRLVQKEYLARVVGKFPSGEVACSQPISVMSQKPSMCKTDSTGKASSTTFQRVSYNGTTSVVRCWPHTGRTHQIRVHLQFLGYPIINDPLYNSPAFGEGRGKGGVSLKSVPEIETEIWKLHSSVIWQTGENPLYQSKFKSASHSPTEVAPTISDTTSGNASDPSSDQHASSDMVSRAADDNQSLEDKTLQSKAGDASVASDECSELLSDPPPSKKVKTSVAEITEVDVKLPGSNNATTVEAESDCDTSRHIVTSGPATDQSSILDKSAVQACTSLKTYLKPSSLTGFDESKMEIVEHCCGCQYLFSDPPLENMVLYLHAVKYTGPDWQYSTELPDWAADDWTSDDA